MVQFAVNTVDRDRADQLDSADEIDANYNPHGRCYSLLATDPMEDRTHMAREVPAQRFMPQPSPAQFTLRSNGFVMPPCVTDCL